MEENLTKECFFTLLDEAEAALSGDSLMEEHEKYDYTVTAPEKGSDTFSDEISSCHKCDACFLRRVYAEPLVGSKPILLFVLPFPEGDTLLSSDSYAYYTKWIAAMGYEMKDVALSSLIKCPVKSFSRETADSCKDWLRSEMKRINPRAIILLGEDSARYMLRRSYDFDTLRLHTYRVNGIPTFCTYTPSSLVRDRGLRAKIWEDLKYIRDAVNGGGDKA